MVTAQPARGRWTRFDVRLFLGQTLALIPVNLLMALDRRFAELTVFFIIPVALAGIMSRSRSVYLALLGELYFDVIVLGPFLNAGTVQQKLAHIVSVCISLTAVGLATEVLYRLARGRRRAEDKLVESEQRYRLLFQRNLAGVFRSTPEGRLLECNAAFGQLLGLGPLGETSGDTSPIILSSFLRDSKTYAPVLELLMERKTLSGQEVEIVRPDGSSAWLLVNLTYLEQERQVEGSAIEITERKRLEQDLRDRATRDALTQLANRTELDRVLGDEFERARRYERKLSLVILDIDHFKQVNDNHGHPKGDEVLREVARCIQGALRRTDFAARYGGEEFCLVLPETDALAAVDVANRLREAIARLELETAAGGRLTVTASLGLAAFDATSARTAGELLAHADQALYQAKRRGRNQVVRWDAVLALAAS